MADTCPNDTKSCGSQKGYRCSLVAMVGSGAFLLLAVNGLLRLVDLHLRQGQAWDRDALIDAGLDAVVAVLALAALVDAVRSFRRGSLGKIAFFGVLMVWSMVLTLVLVYLLVRLAPSFA